MLAKKLSVEGLGTFRLVFGGSAVLAAKFIAADGATSFNLGIGFVGVSLAFGLTVPTMAYAIGHISGCHPNPAVTLGLVAGGWFKASEALPDIVARVVAAVGGAAVLKMVAVGAGGSSWDVGSFASNGFGANSPGKFAMESCPIPEVVLTFFFLFIIMGSTHGNAPTGFALIAIGLGLTPIHLIGIPVTNLSVHPARSTGTAIFASADWPLKQFWLFWAASIAGGVLGGLVSKFLSCADKTYVKTHVHDHE